MSGWQRIVPTKLTKRGNVLVGVIPTGRNRRSGQPKELGPDAWDDSLAAHVATMADGDTVQVDVVFDHEGRRVARLAGVAPLTPIRSDSQRVTAVAAGGFVNPYTFVPTLPRSDREGSRLAGTGLDDAEPSSHAYHADGQWSGTVAVTLTTVTPLLLPVPAARQPQNEAKVCDVRVGPDGRPSIHGASLKGALRSAYETITASRYGVFFEHHLPLAYRANASAALDLTPARVYRNDDGTAYFQLCKGDDDWRRHSREGNKVQYAAWVPAYPGRELHRIGALARGRLTDHHGAPVFARVVAYQYQRGDTRFQVWRATHIAHTKRELEAHLRDAPPNDPARVGKRLTKLPYGHRMVSGWLSATGRSIGAKHDERLFVETSGETVRVTEDHVRYWRAVLRAYDLAHGYNDPQATYRKTPARKGRKASAGRGEIERSYHVPSSPRLRELPPGTLVYVKYDEASHEVTEVHPVMIGRLPFQAAPGELLHESLQPARDWHQLSPADRLFGWVPPSRTDGDTADGAVGYRGRLRIRSITCTTTDWRPPAFPRAGMTLAPLSSPKPTQFRFYASPDDTGTPMTPGAEKAEGYTPGGGLRGRKMYRWRREKPEYWRPADTPDGSAREYLALEGHAPKQLVRHRGWVRPGVTFQVELFLDGVPETELAPLLWMLTRGGAAPLRLGAGKPYGFGVVTAQLDLDRTRVWDATGVRAGWLRLERPDPVGPDRLLELANRFNATARANPVLREATESYLKAAAPVDHPVHYPRTTREPQAESFQWFVVNERENRGPRWSLPHVRDREQRLPYLGDAPAQAGRDSDDRGQAQHRQTRKATRLPRQHPRPEPRSSKRHR